MNHDRNYLYIGKTSHLRLFSRGCADAFLSAAPLPTLTGPQALPVNNG